MKNHLLLLIAVLSLCACNDTSRTDANKDTLQNARTAPAPGDGSVCFQRISGSGMRDTTRVRLDMQGSQVTGTMDVILYEKDSRRGSLSGARDSDGIIRVAYSFMQEGMQDTLSLEFRLTEDALLQRPAVYDPVTGRERPDTAAAFGNKMDKVACW